MKKRWVLLLLVCVLALAVAVPATAGVLTAGSYTYILKGRELNMPVDILSVQGGYLAPEDLVKALGVTQTVKGDSVTLTRGPVLVELTIGRNTAIVDGAKKAVKAAPMQVSDRLFVPVDIFPDLGLSLDVDGKFVLLGDYGPGKDVPGDTSSPEFPALLAVHTVTGSLRATNSVPVRTSITVLTEELLKDKGLTIPWGVRLKLLSLLDDRTLLLVDVQNDSFRSVTLDPSKLLVTDADGRQYKYQNQEISVQGVVTDTIAPGAARRSVLVYEKASGSISLFDDAGNNLLGRVGAP